MDRLVSIIIPTYNRYLLIRETLACVLEQTYENWECLIVDDNSNDNSLEIIKEFLSKDRRFKLIIKPINLKRGASISRNIGLLNAKGDYIQFLDSDDLIEKNKLEEQLKVFKTEDIFTLMTCKWEMFNNKNDLIQFRERADYKNFVKIKSYLDLIGKHGGFFPIHSFLFSKEIISYAGYWNENLLMNDDGEFLFRVLMNAEKICFVESTHVLYRNNGSDNISNLNSNDKANSLINSWKIIEALYLAKFDEDNSLYIEKKKHLLYLGLKEKYKKIVKKNNFFFKNQIERDNLYFKILKIRKKIQNKFKI